MLSNVKYPVTRLIEEYKTIGFSLCYLFITQDLNINRVSADNYERYNH